MELMLVGHNLPDELVAQFAVVDRETLSNKGVLTFRARLNEVSVDAVRQALDNVEAQAEEALAAAYPGAANSAPSEGQE